MTCLRFPGFAAIRRGDDRAKRSDRPTIQPAFRSERDGEEMIANAGLSQHPFVAAVCRRHHDAARAGDHQARPVFDVHPVQRCVGGTLLFLPFETAVVCMQDDAVGTDRPTVALVRRESYRVDRVSLRQRVLPLPAAKRILRAANNSRSKQ